MRLGSADVVVKILNGIDITTLREFERWAGLIASAEIEPRDRKPILDALDALSDRCSEGGEAWLAFETPNYMAARNKLLAGGEKAGRNP